MKPNEIVKLLKAINYALENVEVKGRENMDILLGSMRRIDQVTVELENFFKDLEAAPEVTIEAQAK